MSISTAEAIMVIVMEMETGKARTEPPAYGEEVMNASWLPHPEVATQLQEIKPSPAPRHERMPPPEDIDAFLAAIYRNQE